ncbi:hypothetical protein M514_12393 [Trichuris suis]|uniref:Uncharacterized protein n=1 Tax=Trichuris suis TaxID=68888 RepID=A0A085NTP8_9BILA|nr:hypothetical protein M514_12393 [Trichuris suis]
MQRSTVSFLRGIPFQLSLTADLWSTVLKTCFMTPRCRRRHVILLWLFVPVSDTWDCSLPDIAQSIKVDSFSARTACFEPGVKLSDVNFILKEF